MLLPSFALAADLHGPWASGAYVDLAVVGSAIHATWVDGTTVKYARVDSDAPPQLVGEGAVTGDAGQMRPEVLVLANGEPVVLYSGDKGMRVGRLAAGGAAWTVEPLGAAESPVLFAAASRGQTLLVSWLASAGGTTAVYAGTERPRGDGRQVAYSDQVYEGGGDGVCVCCKPAVAARAEEWALAFRDAAGAGREIRALSSKDASRWTDTGNATSGGWSPGGCPADGPVLTETTMLVSDGRSGKRVIYELSRQGERALPPVDAAAEMLQPRALPDGSLLAWVEAVPGKSSLVVKDGPAAPVVVATTTGRLEPGDPVVVGQDIWFPWQGEKAHVTRVQTQAPPGM